jgi:hypothetical protein
MIGALGMPVFFVFALLAVATDRSSLPLPPMYIQVTGVMVLLLAIGGVFVFRRGVLEARVREREWLACERCVYDLRATASPGVCPECGTPFAASQTIRRWRRAFDRPSGLDDMQVRIEPGLVMPSMLAELQRTCPPVPSAGLRDPFEAWPQAREAVEPARDAAGAMLGRPARLTRAILFDKPPGRNWSLRWHQDLTVALAECVEGAKGFGPWSQKGGVWHAEAPNSLLRQMATVRLHLDDADEGNGCLLVAPFPRKSVPNKLNEDSLAASRRRGIPLVVRAGDAVVVTPLTPHASGRNTTDRHRRVLHMEFAAEQPGQGLRWRDEAEILGQSSSMS